MKRFSAITALLLALTVLLSLFTGCSAKKVTAFECLERIETRQREKADQNEIKSILESALKQGSFELKLDGNADIEGEKLGNVITKLYCSDGAFAADAKVTVGERDFDVKAFLSKDNKLILASSLLSSSYGVAIDDLVNLISSLAEAEMSEPTYDDEFYYSDVSVGRGDIEDDDYYYDDEFDYFDDSVGRGDIEDFDEDEFDYFSDEDEFDYYDDTDDYSSDPADFKAMIEFLKEYMNGKSEAIAEKYKNYVKAYIKDNFNGVITTEKGIYTVTYNINLQDIKGLFNDIYAKLREDDEIKELLYNIAEPVGADKSVVDESLLNENAVNDAFEELSKTVKEINASYVVTADKKFNLLTSALNINLTGKDEDATEYETATMNFAFDCSNNVDSVFSWEIVPPKSESIEAEAQKFLKGNITAHIAEDGKDTKKADVSVTLGTLTIQLVSFSYNNKTNEYSLKYDFSGIIGDDFDLPFSTITVNGIYSAEKGKAILSIDSVMIDDKSISSMLNETGEVNVAGLKLTLTVLAKDTMPSAPSDYKNITELTEEDIAALESELMEKFGN